MVCIPCFIVPVLLFLWHKFIQPYVLRFWNPWAVKDADGIMVKTEAPFSCEGGVCKWGKKASEGEKVDEPDTQKDNVCEDKRLKAE